MHQAPSFLTDRQVPYSEDLSRISGLRRRTWSLAEGAELATELSRMLKTANGTMTLLPVQAIALREFWLVGGLFCSMSVSSGKTLLSALLGTVGQARNPVLMVPAKLLGSGRARGKTEKDLAELSVHWIFKPPTLLSYESLGVVSGKETLEALAPDLLILDEAHKLRNPHASRTRRVVRYLKEHPECRVCVMSGTTIKRSIKDYAHLLKLALRGLAPIPLTAETLEDWDCALSEKIDMSNRIHPGALLQWCEPGEIEEFGIINAARRAFSRRLDQTPGVVCHHVAPEDVGADIIIRELVPDVCKATLDAFQLLREKWELPNGQELVDGCEVYRHSREMALEFYYVWKNPAPRDWLDARKAWGGWVREKLKYSRTYDSPDDVARAFPAQPELLAWKAVRDSYRPETRIEWLGMGVLNQCAQWLREHDGVVFTEHTQFGEQLARLAGVPYFGAGGRDSVTGIGIDDYHGRACVASIASNSEGRNLQRWHKMLVTSPPPNGPGWEQLIGRLHRLGQFAKCVEVWVIQSSLEQSSAFWQAVADAELAEHANKEEPKLALAEILVTPLDELPKGPRWDKSRGKKVLATLNQSATL
jgi:hypothetical protein